MIILSKICFCFEIILIKVFFTVPQKPTLCIGSDYLRKAVIQADSQGQETKTLQWFAKEHPGPAGVDDVNFLYIESVQETSNGHQVALCPSGGGVVAWGHYTTQCWHMINSQIRSAVSNEKITNQMYLLTYSYFKPFLDSIVVL